MKQSTYTSIAIYFLIALLTLAFTSCSSKRALPRSEINITERDSTVTTINYIERDTIIYVPQDRILETLNISQIPKGSTKQFTGTNQAELNISKDDKGNITFEAICTQLQLELVLKDKEIHTLRERLKERQEIIYIPEPYIPFVAKVFMWIGIIAVGGIFIGLIINKLKS